MNLEYKILLVTFFLVGYTVSKFYGIKFIPEVHPLKRGLWIIGLCGVAEVFLIIFGFVGYPFGFIPQLLAGVALGPMWGLTFSYLEGRQFSEVMAAGMGVSTIVSSGILKSISKGLLDTGWIGEYWMPPFVGAIFFPILLFFVFCLESLPEPSENDIDVKTERVQMDGDDRIRYIKEFWPAVITLTALYIFISAYRDTRDNFSVELYASLKVDEGAYIFTISEFIVGFSICIPIIVFTFMKISVWYLVAYFCLIWIGELTLLLWTILIDTGHMGGLYYMVLIGVSTYIAEMPFNGILGDLILALFKYKANSSLFMYITDSFGYAASFALILIKNLGSPNLSWGDFFIKCSYVVVAVVMFLSFVSIAYLVIKLKNWTFPNDEDQNLEIEKASLSEEAEFEKMAPGGAEFKKPVAVKRDLDLDEVEVEVDLPNQAVLSQMSDNVVTTSGE
jgi:MFS family permease